MNCYHDCCLRLISRSKIPTEHLINTFTEFDYSGSSNTARQNSMGRGELVRLYDDFINSKLK